MVFEAKPAIWGGTLALIGLVAALLIASNRFRRKRGLKSWERERYEGWDEMLGI
ncbi:MAG: hypothetical protein ACRDGA_03095 [Bacteroidota bacterium]